MKKIREVREIHLKDHPIAGYSHRIQRGFYHKRKLMQKADGIIDDLSERGAEENLSQKQKGEMRSFVKDLIRQDPQVKRYSRLSAVNTRYRSNELHGVEKVEKVLSKLLLQDCRMHKSYLKTLKENHFTRVKTLKPSAKDKKPRKARR